MFRILSYSKSTQFLKKIAFLISITLCMYISINYSKECADGVKNGIVLCISILIPSLFVFMIIAAYVSNSSLFMSICRVLNKPSRFIFGHDGIYTGVLIIAMIGSYPIGARCISNLYTHNTISKQQAQKLSLMAVCPGVSFLISFVGEAIFSSKEIGYILFVSQATAYFCTCLLCSRCIRIKNETQSFILVNNNESNLVEAVRDACNGTINICAMVILFSAITSVSDKILSSFPDINDVLCSILEITTACNRLSDKLPIYITSFLIGFGGLCVHFQIFSALKNIGINKFLFFLFRIIQGIIASVMTYILVMIRNPDIEVFSSVQNVSIGTYTTVWGCIALIMTAICFLNSIKMSQQKRR